MERTVAQGWSGDDAPTRLDRFLVPIFSFIFNALRGACNACMYLSIRRRLRNALPSSIRRNAMRIGAKAVSPHPAASGAALVGMMAYRETLVTECAGRCRWYLLPHFVFPLLLERPPQSRRGPGAIPGATSGWTPSKAQPQSELIKNGRRYLASERF